MRRRLGQSCRSMSSAVPRARALALVGFIASSAGAQPVYLQSACRGPGSNFDLAFPNDLAPGSLVVVGVTVLGTTATVMGLTDSLGHEFTALTPLQEANFNYRTQVWSAPPLAVGGPNTVHVALSAQTDAIIYIHEYGGFAEGVEIDDPKSTAGEGMQLSLDVRTQGPALVFAYGVSHAIASLPGGSNFTARESCSNDLSADMLAPGAGVWRAVFEQSPGAWTMALVAFRPVATDAGVVDGGTDAGVVDAGVDAGTNDGGVVDAGVAGRPFKFQTHGCSAVGGSWVLLALLVLRRSSVLRA